MLLLLGLILCSTSADSACNKSVWKQQRDNLSEYMLINSSSGVSSNSHCVMIAVRIGSAAHAASFDAAGGICKVFQCRLGDGGCRKCRSAKNLNMPILLVRSKNCWTTFQHRVDASVSFNRNWAEYVAGFGQGEDLNYWMGLESLYNLVSAKKCSTSAACRIRWEFSDWNNNWYWAENTAFSIASSSDKYRLTMGALDTARSNVGQTPLTDTMTPNNQQFSTPDMDNDKWPDSSCAGIYGSGWWFNWCADTVPNGGYHTYPFPVSMHPEPMRYFYIGSPAPLTESYSMKTFELMLLIE